MNSRKQQLIKDTQVIADHATDLSVTTCGMLTAIVNHLESTQNHLRKSKLDTSVLNENLMNALNLLKSAHGYTGKIIDLLEAITRHKLPEIGKSRKANNKRPTS